MTYKYVSLGLNLGRTGAGKVSYLHDSCALQLNSTLGPNAEKYDGEVPPNSICPWCGKEVLNVGDTKEVEK